MQMAGEFTVTTGRGLTVIMITSLARQVPVPKLYVILFKPIFALAGLKLFPKTPVPLHVPPDGVGLFCKFKSTTATSLQSIKSFPAAGTVSVTTVIIVMSLLEHPFPLVKLYVMVCAPTPAFAGLKLPVGETPVPLHVPLFGVPVN